MEKQGTEKYFTLDKQEEQKFILSQNRQVLIDIRNDDIAFYTQEVAIPAALVHLKWQNRREIYALKVKEEIYGAVLNAIMKKDATLKNELEAQIEAAYQQLKTEEAATLMISRRLAEQQYKTKTVPVLPQSEMNTGAAEETSPDSSPEGV
ncbi:cytoplasmic protein [Atlantibacter hermannii]|uniref:cytoplasmic protein n=1 Tax=Atlantibacter hermannii TaxID=565 RepID=UPI00289F0F31|nr:cytoplasmic protein [Atlantibacter hermannii]